MNWRIKVGGIRYSLLGLFVFLHLVACHSIKTDDIVSAEDKIPELIDYNFHVKPILSDRCFKCHGPDKNQIKGDLRLDQELEAHKSTTNESSVAAHVVSGGNVKGSELVLRILSEEPEYMMPPPESHLQLNAEEKAILLRWVDQGAEYKEHWSFVAPESPYIPEVRNQEWSTTEIDHFVLAKMEEKALMPSMQASKEVRLRRATLDLTGLPPTIEEIETFLADDSEDAYEKVLDRLLASDHYGERMALDWLDVARYADSHGYQDDGLRNTWPWRDWVINTFNRNLPYDTFLLWQLAGDLLPSPTEEQLLATCFNRNHPQTQEGGVIDEEYRVEYVADRTNTFGKALIGLTMECARCHDHKYDPITQKDYYSLFAYFNNNNDSGIVPYDGEAAPTVILPSADARKTLDSINQKVTFLEETMRPEHFKEDFESWAKGIKSEEVIALASNKDLKADFRFEYEREAPVHKIQLGEKAPSKPKKGEKVKKTFAYHNEAKLKLDATVMGHIDDRPLIVEGRNGNAVQFVGDAGIQFNHDLEFERSQPFSIGVWIKVLKQGEEGPVFGTSNGEFEGYRGWLCNLNKDGTLSFQLNHVWPDNSIDLQTMDPIPYNDWVHIAMTYDGSSKASGVNLYINGEKPPHKLHADNLHKSLVHGSDESNWSDLPFELGKEFRKSLKNALMDDLKVYSRELAPIEVDYLYHGSSNKMATSEELYEFFLLSGESQGYNKVFEELTALRSQENDLLTDQPEVMIMQERKHPRPTYVLDRGAYDAHGEKVDARVPEMLTIEDKEFRQDRLGLANWLIDPLNPLTARVAVNRLWTVCFGRGLVVTQEDFGSQGNLPSHPELLDYLALKFIELDWDIKAMLKEIMLSSVYQQTSVASSEQKRIDPQNRFYSHYPASRITAEIIRDQALASSGLLVEKIGGPSVYPYQPEGIWEALATRNATEYHQQSGDSLYRRSLYTIWKRSAPPPAMLNFDAPDRYYCIVRRQNTSTPLQSLVLMNDPQFVEAARILAEKMMRLDEEDQGATFAFRRLLGRSPRLDEKEALMDLYLATKESYMENPEGASKLLATGEYPVDQDLDPIDLAARTMIASAIMNFDEFVMKR